jgi:hypothetical protein
MRKAYFVLVFVLIVLLHLIGLPVTTWAAPRPQEIGFQEYNVYLGDIHTHCSDNHSIEDFQKEATHENIWSLHEYAKNVWGYDFFVLSDHAELMNESIWIDHMQVADEWNQPGEFVTLQGYEWTASKYCWRHKVPPPPEWWLLPGFGHQNVYFKDGGTDKPLIKCTDDFSDSPPELHSLLTASGKPAIAIPHHTSDEVHPYDWSYFNPEYNKALEIFQSRGSFEPDLVDYLNQELVFGFVGGSDYHQRYNDYDGITGVLTKELTREAVYEAIKSRRTFASMKPDTYLIFSTWNQLQGKVFNRVFWQMPLRIQASSVGSKIQKVEIIKNGVVIPGATYYPDDFSFDETFSEGSHNLKAYYYARVTLENGNMAWSSPIFVGYQCAEAADDEITCSANQQIAWQNQCTSGDKACCSENSCVYHTGSTCYALGHAHNLDSANNDKIAYCHATMGQWQDCDDTIGTWKCVNFCSEAIGNCPNGRCWVNAGEVGVGEYSDQATDQCCGDDLDEKYSGGTDGTYACCDGKDVDGNALGGDECVLNGTCRDRDVSIEICGNGIDEDCDGQDLVCEQPFSLVQGWNQIIWPAMVDIKASDVPPECPIAVTKENFWIRPYVKNYGGVDFGFVSGRTYYLKCNQAVEWTI